MTEQEKDEVRQKRQRHELMPFKSSVMMSVSVKMTTVIAVGEFSILWNIFEREPCKQSICVGRILKIAKRLAADTVNSVTLNSVFTELAAQLKNRSKNAKDPVTDVIGMSIADYIRKKVFPTPHSRNEAAKRGGEHNIDIFELIESFVNINGASVYEGGLFAIWQIRNNMFHGSKGYIELDDQIDLFEAMNIVLREIVK